MLRRISYVCLILVFGLVALSRPSMGQTSTAAPAVDPAAKRAEIVAEKEKVAQQLGAARATLADKGESTEGLRTEIEILSRLELAYGQILAALEHENEIQSVKAQALADLDALRTRGWFPPLMLFMVAAGERSGALGEMFRRSANQMEQEIDGAVTVGLNLLEPGIILVLGLVVVVIVLSILLPILQLNTLALG